MDNKLFKTVAEFSSGEQLKKESTFIQESKANLITVMLGQHFLSRT